MDNTSSERNQLLKVIDIAKILNISRSFAYELIKKGEIPFVKIGSVKRVKTEDLQDYILKNSSS